MFQATIGRIVHYTERDEFGDITYAALITSVHEPSDLMPLERCDLIVFQPHGIALRGGVPFAERPAPKRWSWPEASAAPGSDAAVPPGSGPGGDPAPDDELTLPERTVYDLDEGQPLCVHDWSVPAPEEMLAMHVLLGLPGRERFVRELPAGA